MNQESIPSTERRSFLTRLNKGAVAALGAIALRGAAKAQVKQATRFEPVRHEKDDWLDQAPGKHRLVFDTINADGLGQSLLFANNFIRVNRTDYGLQSTDLAVIVIVRHRSAPFGFTDAMWAKYGEALAEHAVYEDPKTKGVPKINVFNSSDYASLLPSRGTILEALAKQGVQVAVCGSSTRAMSGVIARAAGGKVDDVFAELSANLVSNARIVPAGIVALNRAQERGYTLASV
jgi:intracellular sulfur oxidation DsrE/DsrF family protein